MPPRRKTKRSTRPQARLVPTTVAGRQARLPALESTPWPTSSGSSIACLVGRHLLPSRIPQPRPPPAPGPLRRAAAGGPRLHGALRCRRRHQHRVPSHRARQGRPPRLSHLVSSCAVSRAPPRLEGHSMRPRRWPAAAMTAPRRQRVAASVRLPRSIGRASRARLRRGRNIVIDAHFRLHRSREGCDIDNADRLPQPRRSGRERPRGEPRTSRR